MYYFKKIWYNDKAYKLVKMRMWYNARAYSIGSFSRNYNGRNCKQNARIRNLKDESKTKLLENQLEDLIKLQEEAYKGDRKAVLKILNREF